MADGVEPRLGVAEEYQVMDSHRIYDGAVVSLRIDDVTMPGGRTARREIAEHPGGVGIIAIDEYERVCLITQYRHPLRARIWEVPAGLRDIEGESPEETAARELAEEVGLQARHWHPLVRIAVSPGFTDEVVEIFLARGLSDVPRGERRDEEAEIETHWIALDEALKRIDSGEIYHGIAVAGIQAAARYIRR